MTALVLWVLLSAVFFYVLYLVVRSAVRDGIRLAALPDDAVEPTSGEPPA
jgi:hypothetical protein